MGKLTQIQRPDSTTQFEYTPTDFLKSLTHAKGSAEILDQFRYIYDPAGQITQINKYRRHMPGNGQEPQDPSRSYSDNGVFQYAYDPAGRLTNAVHNGQQKEYFYDSLGNRIASCEPAPDSGRNRRTYHQYNALNQQIRSQGRDILEEYHYDRRGNMTEILTNGRLKAGFVFDAANKMTQALTDKGQVHYTYDGFLNRVKRLEQLSSGEPARETRYILDTTLAYDNLLMTEGSQNQAYVWGHHLLSATGATELTYLQDHLHSPIRLLGQKGQDAVLNYDEFGALWTEDGPASLSEPPLEAANPFGFTGYQTEDMTGLYYAQARYYNPLTSRWLSEDPIRAGLNWYTYCRNNPLRFVDPSGLIPSDLEAAYMAEDVYNVSESDYGKVLPGGWRLTQIMRNGEGMRIAVYERTVNGVTEYTLANKGTTATSFGDWANNLQQPFGWSDDMQDSIDQSGSFVQNHQGSEVTMVGHSKGGAEAVANAVNSNTNCIVFNPATTFLGSNGLSTDNYDAHMQVFVVRGEALNVAEGWFSRPIGSFEYLPTQHKTKWWHYLVPLTALKTSVDNHSMGAVIWGLKERCGGTCPVGQSLASPVIWAPPQATHSDFQSVVPGFAGGNP